MAGSRKREAIALHLTSMSPTRANLVSAAQITIGAVFSRASSLVGLFPNSFAATFQTKFAALKSKTKALFCDPCHCDASGGAKISEIMVGAVPFLDFKGS